jgi:sorting nexin-29
MLQLLYDIRNAGRTPEEWETALVVTIFKKGDKSKCENCRGISLFPTAYKLYEKILKDKLQPIAEKILGEEQCGLRKGRSKTDTIFTIKQIIEKTEHLMESYICCF